MLESYQLEILRKRRVARIFWLIVFICSWFLYFFFQGYYPDVRVGLRHIFSETGSKTDYVSSDLIRSFGIINVRSIPTDAIMLLGSGAYGNNEKRMSDYGDYSMTIEKSGYIKNSMKFIIDREKPFFIEKISLFPNPAYKKLEKISTIYPIEKNGEYLAQTLSGNILSSGSIVNDFKSYSGSLKYIGWKYFNTSSGALEWKNTKLQKASAEKNNFIKTCKNIKYQSSILYCPESKSLLTEWDKYMTGILDIRNNLIARSGSILEVQNGNIGKTWNQTGEINLANIHIIHSNILTEQSGSLISKIDPKLNIITGLEKLNTAAILDENLLLFGEKWWEKHLLIRHSSDTIERERDISLPENIDYSQIEFRSLAGNILITTKTTIFLIYRGSNEFHWILDGEILSLWNTGAIYKQNNEIWESDWSE